jgi:hypothetical protein
MKQFRPTSSLAAAACLVLAASAVAAPEEPVGQIMRIDGSAMISQGTRYVDAREGMPLRAQDRVLVLDGGSALLQFTDGCQYSLNDSELLTIGSVSACAEQSAQTAATEPGVSVETAAATGQLSFEGLEQGATSQLGGAAAGAAGGITGALVLGGLVVAGGIAAAADGLGSDDREDNRPPISQ